MSNYSDIIASEPGKRGGQPCVRDLRISVADVLGWLAAGMSHDEIRADFPDLSENDIRACLSYAADRERRLLTANWMKLLFDQNLSFKLCSVLDDVFPKSCHIGQLGLARVDDRHVWEAAKAGGFVSQDIDFAEMAVLRGAPPKVLWLRCDNRPTLYVGALPRDSVDAIRAFEAHPSAVCLEVY